MISVPGRIAVICAAGAVVIIGVNVWSPAAALFTPSPGAPTSIEQGAVVSRMDARVAMVDGRSLFFTPAPPPPPAPPPRIVEDDGPEPPPPPPSRYAGPNLIAMINDIAWFADGARLGVDEAQGDLTVKSLNPPWEAVVDWKGVEFTVSLFKRDGVVLPNRDAEIADTGDAADQLALDDDPDAAPTEDLP